MPYKRSFDVPEVITEPPCMFLRSKAIYVTGNPDPIDPADRDSHRYNCWCNKTQRITGPDDDPVARETCISGRGCFQPRM